MEHCECCSDDLSVFEIIRCEMCSHCICDRCAVLGDGWWICEKCKFDMEDVRKEFDGLTLKQQIGKLIEITADLVKETQRLYPEKFKLPDLSKFRRIDRDEFWKNC